MTAILWGSVPRQPDRPDRRGRRRSSRLRPEARDLGRRVVLALGVRLELHFGDGRERSILLVHEHRNRERAVGSGQGFDVVLRRGTEGEDIDVRLGPGLGFAIEQLEGGSVVSPRAGVDERTEIELVHRLLDAGSGLTRRVLQF